ncbi:MAG: HD domain-containing protein, partial [Nitrospirae bacterium]|nr:HD domain-containing protein [Nitrospirota bacterium]
KLSHLYEAGESSPCEINKPIDEDSDVLINKAAVPLYEEYLKSLSKAEVSSGEEKQRIKAVLVKEHSKIVVKDVLENPLSREKIKLITDLVGDTINCIFENKDAIYDLLTLKKHDYNTYMHSVNVAALSIGLASAIGLDKDKIEKLGIGAMLHDIGKMTLPTDLLNKEGKMNNTEYQSYKGHVLEGVKILKKFDEISQETLTAVLQHHEKLSGKGYPLGLRGDDIKLFGRITGIADCYDALTTPMPNRYSLDAFRALSVIAKEKEDYDLKLLKEFVAMLGKLQQR